MGRVTFALSPLIRGIPLARKILLADDSVTAQNMGRKILADAGYEVITVNNGSAALKKIGEQKPDLIVLDVYMPGYSGLEVCQRLKEAGDTSRIPILLTVGKLEPFKPEEARRVRADGFIVKPFEASELLSALSKLEDKVVPRSESSKPGRFARAASSIDEPRYDRTVANDEDSGWKSRIVFPKKKEKAPEPEVEDSTIYNPVNKDLKTVIEHKLEEAPVQPPVPVHQPGTQQEERVNVGALATDGLPKDVTPEEIAALAAAAAQVKGTIEEIKAEEKTPVAEMAVSAPVEIAFPAPESKVETKEQTPVAEPVVPTAEPALVPEPAVTLAEQPKSEKPEKEAQADVSAIPAEVMAAIAGLEPRSPAPDSLVSSPASGNGSWSGGEKSDEPVTMAVAATASAAASNPRWTAVAVALDPEESAISLEQEMQKAQAAVVPVESAPDAVSSVSTEPAPVAEPVEAPPTPPSTEVASSTSEVAQAPEEVPATPAPEAATSFAEVASAAKEAVTAAISELASVATSFLAQEHAPSEEAAPASSAEPVPQPVSSSAPVNETKPEETIAAAASNAPEETVEPKSEEPEIKPAEIEAKSADTEAKAVKEATEPGEEKPVAEKKEVAEPVAETAAPKDVDVEVPDVQESTREAVPTADAPESVDYTAGGTDEMAKKESEITATTAAAWASWRKIRESGRSKPGQTLGSAKEMNEPEDSAAMAVAAGAEGKPEDVNTNFDSDPEIASIVDSVLADMRPKIVEEIARKLGKKK